MFVHLVDHLLVQNLAFSQIFDCLEFLAVPERDGTFETHAPDFAGRPCDRKDRLFETAASHGLSAQAVSLASDDRHERHA